jgi:hypothetical protein
MTALTDVENKMMGFEAGGVDSITKSPEKRSFSKSQIALAGLANPRKLEDLRLHPPGAFRDLLSLS